MGFNVRMLEDASIGSTLRKIGYDIIVEFCLELTQKMRDYLSISL